MYFHFLFSTDKSLIIYQHRLGAFTVEARKACLWQPMNAWRLMWNHNGKIALCNHRASETKHLGPQRKMDTTQLIRHPKYINKLPQSKNLCLYGVIETVSNAFITALHSRPYATEGSALAQLGLPSSRHITLPSYWMNKPVISLQTQSFLHWLAAPGMLPGEQLQ